VVGELAGHGKVPFESTTPMRLMLGEIDLGMWQVEQLRGMSYRGETMYTALMRRAEGA
jgi:hypothetical protein